jgi:hypothetical protein
MQVGWLASLTMAAGRRTGLSPVGIYSIVWYSTVQHRQYSTVQYSTVQCSTVVGWEQPSHDEAVG